MRENITFLTAAEMEAFTQTEHIPRAHDASHPNSHPQIPVLVLAAHVRVERDL